MLLKIFLRTRTPESNSKHTMQVDWVISNLFNTAAEVGVVNLHMQGLVLVSDKRMLRFHRFHKNCMFYATLFVNRYIETEFCF